MAKSAADNSGTKTRAKQAGQKSALARSASRASQKAAGSSRSSQTVRGAVSSKPRGRWRTFFGEVRTEMGKVTWPSRKELLQSTAVVIVLVVIASVYIGLFDYIWGVLVRVVGLG